MNSRTSTASRQDASPPPLAPGAAGGGYPVAPAALVDSTLSATTVTDWWDDYDWAWQKAASSHVAKWDKRAKLLLEKASEAESDGKLAYAERRARALAMDPSARVAECGERNGLIRCGCRRVVVAVGCRQRWLCDTCRTRYARRLRRKLHRSTRTWSRARPGDRQRWVMLTGTVRHSGSVAADREQLGDAWRKLRQWVHKRIGSFPYALVWEVTPGRDGRGHVHWHAVVLWPWLDWNDVRAQWKRAIGDDGAELDMKACRKGPGGAAEYVSKYAGKGTNLRKMPPVLAAHVSSAFYGRRMVTASRGFWFPPPRECRSCGELYKLERAPGNLPGALPFDVWRSLARRREVESWRVGWTPQISSVRLL